MYERHFGLSALPFENVPDPAFFFDAGEYRRILRRVTEAVAAGRGLLVVAGPIGSGKTTLSQKLLAGLGPETAHLWLAEPPATDRDLLQLLLRRLGCPIAWESRVLALDSLRERLLEIRARGGRFLLVVDESHKISDEALETVRLLNNLEEGAHKLIQILLLGQAELEEMLKRAGREAFRQRIANFEILGRMPREQIREYVLHRLGVAGGSGAIIPDPMLDAVAEASGGIPRLINSLCDRALLHACEGGKGAVDSADLLRAAEHVGLDRKAFHFLVARRPAAAPAPTGAAGDAPQSPAGRMSAPPFPAADPPDPADPAVPGAPAAGSGSAAAPVVTFAAAPTPAPAPTDAPHPAPDPDAPARRSLTGPLLVLAAGVAALAASLSFYCSRAGAIHGGACLPHLVRDILSR